MDEGSKVIKAKIIEDQAKARIAEIDKFVSDEGKGSRALGLAVYALRKELRDPEFAKEFALNGGQALLFKILKLQHRTLSQEAMKAFLNLMCHFQVLSTIADQIDPFIIPSVLDLLQPCGRFGEHSIIQKALAVLSVILGLAPKLFDQFHNFIVANSQSNSVLAYSQFFICLGINQNLRLKTLHLLDLILCRSALVGLADEVIDALTNCNICGTLVSIHNLTREEQCVASHILLPFGNSASRRNWEKSQGPEKEPYSLMIHTYADEEIAEQIDGPLAIHIEGQISCYNDKLQSIFQHRNHRVFYTSIQALIQRLLILLALSIKSNGAKRMNLGAQSVSLPEPSKVENFVKAIIFWAKDTTEGPTDLFLGFQKICQVLSRKLTSRYGSQLFKVREVHLHLLVCYAVWRIIEYVRKEIINPATIIADILKCVATVSLDKKPIFLRDGKKKEHSFFTSKENGNPFVLELVDFLQKECNDKKEITGNHVHAVQCLMKKFKALKYGLL